MNDSTLKLIISALDNASGPLKQVGAALGNVKDAAVNVGHKGFAVAKGAFDVFSKAVLIGVPLITTALGGIGLAGLKAADQFEVGQLKYETLLGSQEAALQRVKELQQFAANTPLETGEITKADIILQGFGIRSEKMLETIGNAAAITESGFADVALVMGQLSQSKDLENVKQLVERGIISFDELRNAGIRFAKDGSVINSVDETYGAIVGIMEKKFAGGMDKLSGTMSGMWSTISDGLNIGLGEVAKESGLMDLVKSSMKELIAWIGTIDWKKVGQDIKTFVKDAVDKFWEFYDYFENTLKPAVLDFVDKAWTPLQNAFTWFTDVLWPIIQPILAMLADMFMKTLWPALQNLWAAFMRLWDILGPRLIPILQFVGAIIGAVLVVGIMILIGALTFLANIFTFVVDVFGAGIKMIVDWFAGMTTAGQGLFDFFAGLFTGDWDRMWKGAGTAFEGLKNMAEAQFNGIKDIIFAALRAVANPLRDFRNSINGQNFMGVTVSLPEIPQFADGGVVGGNSYTGDKILARVNSGEVILNQKQQKNALNQMEGGNSYNLTVNIEGGSMPSNSYDLRRWLEDNAGAVLLDFIKKNA